MKPKLTLDESLFQPVSKSLKEENEQDIHLTIDDIRKTLSARIDKRTPGQFAKWFEEAGDLTPLTYDQIAYLAEYLKYPVTHVANGWEGDDDYVIGDLKWLEETLIEQGGKDVRFDVIEEKPWRINN